MRLRWRASVLAAAGAATLLAGCGTRVAEEPSPSPERAVAAVVPGPAPPASSPAVHDAFAASPAPVPTASSASSAPDPSPAVPALPAPGPCGRRDAALEAAARRVAAAADVRGALPAFAQLAETMVERSGVPGAAVAVIAGDTVMYERAYGLREGGPPRPGGRRHPLPTRRGVSRVYRYHARRARGRG